jgi:transketolase C-terminal domain/subunit
VPSSRTTKPAYVRVGRNAVEDIYTEDSCPFEMDKATWLKEGTDIAIVATGELVRPALDAAAHPREPRASLPPSLTCTA